MTAKASTQHTPHRRAAPRAGVPPIIGGVLAVALFAGYLIGDERQLLMVAVFVLPPLLLVTLRAFDRVVLALPWAALLITSSLPTGTESRISMVMLLVVMLSGIWIVSRLMPPSPPLVRSPLNAPLITFTLICGLSFVWSVAFRDPLLIRFPKFALVQLGALAAMMLSPLATLLVANFVRTPRGLWLIAAPFLLVGGVTTLLYLLGKETNWLNTRGLFPLWFVAVAYAVIVAQPKLPLVAKLALGVLLAVYGYYIGYVSIAWLSGWVPPLVAIAAITLFRSRRAFVVLALVLAAVVVWQQQFLYKAVFEDSEKEGDFERLTLWQLNVELLENHPLLGTGPAGYALYYVTYHPQEARSTHNNYLDIIAQTGLLGSACWLWLVAATIREGWAVLRRAPPGTLRTLGLAACGGLVGAAAAMALGDWVLPFSTLR